MKVVILCGGRGVRLSEETDRIPKPMVKIGDLPLVTHIINIYSHYRYNDFLLCLGYKQEIIKEYFYNFNLNNSDISINLSNNKVKFIQNNNKDIKVDLIDTGEDTLTGSRLIRIKDYIKDDMFMLTYADGLSDIDINELIKFHKSHGKIATLTSIRKKGKFGVIQTNENLVTSFYEKPVEDSWINGGFFVLNKEFFNYLKEGDLPDTLEVLAKEKQLMTYKYYGNWECVDTINDKLNLEKIYNNGNAFWIR